MNKKLILIALAGLLCVSGLVAKITIPAKQRKKIIEDFSDIKNITNILDSYEKMATNAREGRERALKREYGNYQKLIENIKEEELEEIFKSLDHIIHIAAKYGQTKIVKYILNDVGVSLLTGENPVTVRNKYAQTPAHLAARGQGKLDVIRAIAEYIDPKATTLESKLKGEDPSLDEEDELALAKIDEILDLKDARGRSPLRYALTTPWAGADPNIVEYLLKFGAGITGKMISEAYWNWNTTSAGIADKYDKGKTGKWLEKITGEITSKAKKSLEEGWEKRKDIAEKAKEKVKKIKFPKKKKAAPGEPEEETTEEEITEEVTGI